MINKEQKLKLNNRRCLISGHTYERERERVNAAARIFSYENLLRCYYECRKRKRYTVNAAKFEIHFEDELLKLKKELEAHTYRPGRSICFVVSKPKPREIFAADFRDRVVHHILVNYLEPIWEPKFIDQSYSCRKGKGAHRAIKDLKRYIRKASKGNSQKAYYLQVDIQSFFVSLKKDILFEIIKRHTKNPEILWLAEVIIFHNPTSNYYRKCQASLFDLIPDHKSLFKVSPDQGLPIGNLTSQFFANVYLNELDQFMKHKLKEKYYLRYVDDLVLLSPDKNQLKIWRDEIDRFLQEKLKLKLHPKKQILQTVDKGIDFVGYVVKPDYVLMRRRIVKNLKAKLWQFNQNLEEITEQESKQILSAVNSYYGQFRHAKTFGLRQKLWQKNFSQLQNFLEPIDENISYFKIK
jgi:retron-type reverse transcriptase